MNKLKQFLDKNPPFIICGMCGNPLVLKEDGPNGQILHCRFCISDTTLAPNITVDTIKSPFGQMVVSFTKGIKKNNDADED